MPSNSKNRDKRTGLNKLVDKVRLDCQDTSRDARWWATFCKYSSIAQSFFVIIACCSIVGVNEIKYGASNGHDLTWIALCMGFSQVFIVMFHVEKRGIKYMEVSSKIEAIGFEVQLIATSDSPQEEKISRVADLSDQLRNLKQTIYDTTREERRNFNKSNNRRKNYRYDSSSDDEEIPRAPRGRAKKSKKSKRSQVKKDPTIIIHDTPDEEQDEKLTKI